MNDPYEILGVSRNASEEEINTAYRKLVKQYHPDRYVGNPLADLAKEKIVEINSAYDSIMEDRKKRGSSYDNEQNNRYNSKSDASEYDIIRKLINQNRIVEAENMLNKLKIRDAQWHFLMGWVMKKKGWYDMAYQHFERASSMEPSNREYRDAKDNMDFSGTTYREVGNSGGYGVSFCDTCQALICADCCCEMCGGDMISCI